MDGINQVLEHQRELAHWWATPTGKEYAKVFMKGKSLKHERIPALGNPGDPDIGWHQNLFLPQATPYFVSDDVLTLIEAAAKTMPGVPLWADDPMHATGFVWFERTLLLPGKDLTMFPVRALMWADSGVFIRKADGTFEQGTTPGILLSIYADTAEFITHHENRMEPEAAEGALRNFSAGLTLMHYTAWPFGRSADEVVPHHEANDNDLIAFLGAFWQLARQQVTVITPHRGERHTRRRFERELKTPPSDVRVLTLRRLRPRHDREDEPGFVEWSHRWLVSGHWRKYWSDKEQRWKVTWVRSYVKGPADKPLILKDDAVRFVR